MHAESGDDRRGHRKRLKQKFLTAGMAAFLDHEVLELLLIYAIPRQDVKPLANKLLREFGSLKGVVDAEISDLNKVPGISEHTAVLFKLLKELVAAYGSNPVLRAKGFMADARRMQSDYWSKGRSPDAASIAIYKASRKQAARIKKASKSPPAAPSSRGSA